MNEVDPSALTAADWDQVTVTLSFIWAFFGAQVSAALNFTLAHAFIPSLVTTGHIPKAANKVRPFFLRRHSRFWYRSCLGHGEFY